MMVKSRNGYVLGILAGFSGSSGIRSSRATVAERGMALADAFDHMHKQLLELREDLNASVKIKVDEINSIATQIADLNLQILSIKIAGKAA